MTDRSQKEQGKARGNVSVGAAGKLAAKPSQTNATPREIADGKLVKILSLDEIESCALYRDYYTQLRRDLPDGPRRLAPCAWVVGEAAQASCTGRRHCLLDFRVFAVPARIGHAGASAQPGDSQSA